MKDRSFRILPALLAAALVWPEGARAGEQEIDLPAGIHRPGVLVSGARAGSLVVTGRLAIRGAGRDATVLEGDGTGPVLEVAAGATLELSGVTVRGGRAAEPDHNGGGILVYGRLVLSDSTVTRNQADYEGGGIMVAWEDASALITRSVINGNEAGYGGAGIEAYGTVEIADSTITGNSAGYGGGGIDLAGSGTLKMTGSTVSGNRSGYGGGGIELEQSWLGKAAATITRSTIRGNSAGYEGGGINNYGRLTLIDSTVDGNSSAYSGGGIQVNGTLTMSGSTVSNNVTGGTGPDAWGEGGGICIVTWWGGRATATITNSTISGNRAFRSGGGLVKWGEGAVVLQNVTVANNTADSDEDGEGDGGGGIFALYAPNVRVGATIVAGNLDGGGEAPDCAGTLKSLGYNMIGNLTGCGLTGDVTGNVTDVDARLSPLGPFRGPTQTHALLEGSPAIDALAPVVIPGSCGDAFLEGSPAIDVLAPVVSGSCSGVFLGVDQRAVTRPQAGGYDIGAVERTCAGDAPDLGCDAAAVKCYDARTEAGVAFESRALSLTDAMGSTTHELLAPAAACNAAGADGSRASDGAAPLLCYRVRDLAATRGQRQVVSAANEFGTERLKLVSARTVCIAEGVATAARAYKCYKARRAGRGPRFVPRALMLADEVETKMTLVLKPELLCTRASSGGDVSAPGAAIECYRIENQDGQTPSPVRHLNLDGQSLVAGGPRWLCMPTFTDLGAR